MKQTSTATRNAAAPVLTQTATATLQRQCACGQHAMGGECESCKKNKSARVDREASDHEAAEPRQAGVHEAMRTPGQPLDAEIRSRMESRFNHDFSGVRVHTDVRAAESARALHANAWALGSDLVFAQGAYNPQSAAGQHLIAHELAHVIQQQHAPAADPQTDLEVSEPGDAPEREAEAAADQVLAGDPASVQEQADGATVHREMGAGATAGLVGGIIGGGVLLGLGVAWLAGAFDSAAPTPQQDDDASNIEKPPACGARQLNKLKPAISKATALVKAALVKLRAFKNNPKPAADDYVRARLNVRFKSDVPATVNLIERVAAQIERLLTSSSPKKECHVEKSDSLCAWASAYVSRDTGTVVFCPRYFRPNSTTAEAIVHEYAHATTGGAHIVDRGYQNERILPELSTNEALNNAESYAEFIQDLAEGKPVADPLPADKFTCAKELQPAVKLALARAERWNTNSVNVFLSPKPESQNQAASLRNQFLPPTFPVNPLFAIDTTSIDVSYISKVLKKTNEALGGPVQITCDPDGAPCAAATGGVYFTAGDSQIHVCPAWINEKDPDKQILSMLATLYGSVGGETRVDWQMGLANIAQSITSGQFALPKPEEMFGSSTWNKDMISVAFFLDTAIPGAKHSYDERATAHNRLSQDLPVFKGPDCQASLLHFAFSGGFFVDEGSNRRPGPFAPPLLTLEYAFDSDIGHDQANSGKLTDTRPQYNGPGIGLKTPLEDSISLTLQRNGTLATKIRMEDPDTGTVRQYDDHIGVVADRPCNLPRGQKRA